MLGANMLDYRQTLYGRNLRGVSLRYCICGSFLMLNPNHKQDSDKNDKPRNVHEKLAKATNASVNWRINNLQRSLFLRFVRHSLKSKRRIDYLTLSN